MLEQGFTHLLRMGSELLVLGRRATTGSRVYSLLCIRVGALAASKCVARCRVLLLCNGASVQVPLGSAGWGVVRSVCMCAYACFVCVGWRQLQLTLVNVYYNNVSEFESARDCFGPYIMSTLSGVQRWTLKFCCRVCTT